MDASGFLNSFLSQWYDSSAFVPVHTSGSTGAPKLMLASKEMMMNSARITCDFLGLKKGDRALLCMPLEYIAGKMMVVRSIERGLELVCVAPSNHPYASLPDCEPAFDLVAMVPSQLFCSLQVERERTMLMAARNLIIGGGKVSCALESVLADFPNAVWSTYGMTETLSHIALRRLSGPDADGWYTPFESVRLSSDEEGCLVIDAPHVHKGVLHTNDIVEFHTDGRRFRVKGRRDNVICCGGIKLHIEKIEEQLEDLLTRCEGVADFCVGARKDDKFGEVAVLLVEASLGADTAVLLESLTSCFAGLEKFSRPKEIVFTDTVPRTGTGKIDRRSVAEILALREAGERKIT